MDWFRAIAELIEGLAWPTVALAVVVLLRHELGALIGRLSEFSGPAGVSASFSHDAKELPAPDVDDPHLEQSRPESLQPSEAGPDDSHEPGDVAPERCELPISGSDAQVGSDSITELWTFRTDMIQQFQGFDEVAEEAPGAAVRLAWSNVTLAVSRAGDAIAKQTGTPIYDLHPYLATKAMARVAGFENLETFAEWAKELGNLSGRSRREKVSAEAARNYVSSADGFTSHFLGAVVVLLQHRTQSAG